MIHLCTNSPEKNRWNCFTFILNRINTSPLEDGFRSPLSQIGQTWMSHKYDPWSEHQSPHLESDPKSRSKGPAKRVFWCPAPLTHQCYQRSLPCPHLQGAYGLVGADTWQKYYNKVLGIQSATTEINKTQHGPVFPNSILFLLYGCSIFSNHCIYCALFD